MLDANNLRWTHDPLATVDVGAKTWTAATPFEAALAAPVGGKSTAVPAYANHGRWVVECPDCHGAQLTRAEDPKFMCDCCANVAVGGNWRPVIWPKDRDIIDALLDARPFAETRHWTLAETVKDLRTENKAFLG